MTNDGLRAQMTRSPGTQAAVTVGYVAAGAPSLVVALVAAHDGLDDATVQFLLAKTLLAKQQEDEEARQAEELREWEDKFAKSETRIVEEVDRLRRLGDRSERSASGSKGVPTSTGLGLATCQITPSRLKGLVDGCNRESVTMASLERVQVDLSRSRRRSA